MENQAAIITRVIDPLLIGKSNESGLEIKMKANKDVTAQNIYHTIVVLLEWVERVNQIDSQQVVEALAQYKTAREHYYKPVM